MEVRLLVDHPAAETKQIRLGAETLIGRGVECKLRISSGQVSRRHCVIKVAESTVSVRDLGSANGTRLNGMAIAADTDVPIVAGSTLAIGPLKFVVQFAAPRTTADEDTEWLPDLTAAAKAVKSSLPGDPEETKDYPPSKQRGRRAPPQVIVARDNSPTAIEPSPTSDAVDESDESDAGRATEHDISVDPAETVFDVSLDDRLTSPIPGAAGPGARSNAEQAAETHLLFEEDDLQRLVADVEAAATARKPAGSPGADADSETADESSAAESGAAGRGLLGFLKRKKKPETSRPAPPPDVTDDPLNKFLRDA